MNGFNCFLTDSNRHLISFKNPAEFFAKVMELYLNQGKFRVQLSSDENRMSIEVADNENIAFIEGDPIDFIVAIAKLQRENFVDES